MMFSTSAGEALPVRTPANSFTTTCSVLLILSSASSKKSSSVIGAKVSKARRNCIEATYNSAISRFSASCVAELVADAHHRDADHRRIGLVGLHAGLDVFDDLEEQAVGRLVVQAGEPLDVAGRAVNELQVAGHHPDHVIAHHPAQAHHGAGRERVEQHLQAGARDAVQQEVGVRDRRQHGDALRIPLGEEVADLLERLLAPDDRSRRSGRPPSARLRVAGGGSRPARAARPSRSRKRCPPRCRPCPAAGTCRPSRPTLNRISSAVLILRTIS